MCDQDETTKLAAPIPLHGVEAVKKARRYLGIDVKIKKQKYTKPNLVKGPKEKMLEFARHIESMRNLGFPLDEIADNIYEAARKKEEKERDQNV